MTTEQKKYIEYIGRCELCGSRRNLELHHIIPMVCQPLDYLNVLKKPIQLDIETNWICICGSCHSKLTPRGLLIKYGANNRVLLNQKLIHDYGMNAIVSRVKSEVYEKICKYTMTIAGSMTFEDWWDAIDYGCGRKENTFCDNLHLVEDDNGETITV